MVRNFVIVHIRERHVGAALEAQVISQLDHLRIAAVQVDERRHLPRLFQERERLVPVIRPVKHDGLEPGELLEVLERHNIRPVAAAKRRSGARHVDVVRVHVPVALVADERLDVGRVTLDDRHERAHSRRGVSEVHNVLAQLARVGAHGRRVRVQLHVGVAVVLDVARPRRLQPRLIVLYGKLHVGPPVLVVGPQVPCGKIALVAVVGRVGAGLAAPVGAANSRPVPEVDRVVPSQKHVFEPWTAVPAVLECLRAGAVPHDDAGLSRCVRDEVLHVSMVTRQRQVWKYRTGDDLSADIEAPGTVKGNWAAVILRTSGDWTTEPDRCQQ